MTAPETSAAIEPSASPATCIRRAIRYERRGDEARAGACADVDHEADQAIADAQRRDMTWLAEAQESLVGAVRSTIAASSLRSSSAATPRRAQHRRNGAATEDEAPSRPRARRASAQRVGQHVSSVEAAPRTVAAACVKIVRGALAGGRPWICRSRGAFRGVRRIEEAFGKSGFEGPDAHARSSATGSSMEASPNEALLRALLREIPAARWHARSACPFPIWRRPAGCCRARRSPGAPRT